MKADGVGNRIYSDIVASTHQPKPAKTKTTPVSVISGSKNTSESSASIERADRIAAKVTQKLQAMANVLDQIGTEKNDVIREQLARFFNVLQAFIEEALHPTGDWSTDQIMSGKIIKVDGDNGATVAVQGERITMGSLEIRELSKSPTNEDINAMLQNIKKAQTSIKKLRNSLAAARVQIAHNSMVSSEITL
jgi:CRISPR/Cas system CSM-associated protein Csm2 small subunit